jgi:hypothetical protein
MALALVPLRVDPKSRIPIIQKCELTRELSERSLLEFLEPQARHETSTLGFFAPTGAL